MARNCLCRPVEAATFSMATEKVPSASDLTGFGTKDWIRGLLENPDQPRYFGHTKLGGMKAWSAKHHDFRNTLKVEMESAGKKN